jgi:proline iminopeptidase
MVWDMVDTPSVDRLLFHSQEVAKLNRKMWEENKLKNTGLMYEALKKEHQSSERLIDRARADKARTLIMVGLYDRNVGVDLIRDLATVIPNSKLVVFENSAHFPDMEETEKYVASVQEFVQQKR